MSCRSSWGSLLLYRRLGDVISKKIQLACWKRSSSFLQRCLHEDALLSAQAARLNLHKKKTKKNRAGECVELLCTVSSEQLLSLLEMRLLGPLVVSVGFLCSFWFLESWSFVPEIFYCSFTGFMHYNLCGSLSCSQNGLSTEVTQNVDLLSLYLAVKKPPPTKKTHNSAGV